MATRQTSSSGRPKSPRIQVVLPEELCERLAAVADAEARTVSNMARVLIQQGLERYERDHGWASPAATGMPQGAAAGGPVTPAPVDPHRADLEEADRFRQALEQQGQGQPRRLRGAPRRLRLQRPPG